MSEAVAAPVVETPAPVALGAVETLAEYRERRSKGDDGSAVETPKAEEKPAETPKPEAKAAEGENEPDPASEAGKALAAKRGSLQARIDEITRKAGETERQFRQREAELLAELAALKTGKPTEAAKPAAQEPAVDPNDPEPKVDDFDDYQKFVKAVARWEARQERKAAEAEAAQRAATHGAATAQHRALEAGKAAYPDWDDAMQGLVEAGGAFSPVARDVILNHPIGHSVAYALAKDPALNARIGALPVGPALLEIGKLVAKIEGDAATAGKPKEEPKPKPVSKAPAPVAEVGAGETVASQPDPSKMTSVTEWRKRRAEFDK